MNGYLHWLLAVANPPDDVIVMVYHRVQDFT